MKPTPAQEPCYSMRLVRPFLKVLREHPQFPASVLEPLETQDPDDRMAISTLLELLRGAVMITGDEDLGLKAAMAADLGEYDVLEYAAGSCETGREALDVLVRYVPLVNEACELQLTDDEGVLTTRMRSLVPLGRQAADFQFGALIAAVKRWAADAFPGDRDIEYFFMHSAPQDQEAYKPIFGAARIHFDAGFDGCRYASAVLDRPLPSADANLNNVLRRHAEQMFKELPQARTWVDRVRDCIVKGLPEARATAELVADDLHMSRRTLTRRLEEEGTNFKALLDDMRRQLALRYLEQTDIGAAEIALLTGFSQAAPFNRAFRRWTGQTPTEYRAAHR